jgi:hypothetical protein
LLLMLLSLVQLAAQDLDDSKLRSMRNLLAKSRLIYYGYICMSCVFGPGETYQRFCSHFLQFIMFPLVHSKDLCYAE